MGEEHRPGDRGISDPERAESGDELIRRLSPEALSMLSERVALAVMETYLKKNPPELVDRLRILGFTEEIAGLLQILAARSDDSREGVLRKALTLYGLALDAREKGNRLAILGPDDVIIHEVVGFEPVEDADPVAT